ncbi:ArsR/SmtB family transcription factor [Agrobacterium pusense]|uniref:ArsR/SmtB family transcription factor n=1 Tax=Agrobacterium pusense TaxID=648995 RepID=UPI00088CD535|nr:helix-turn-helix domain-containing protein [Agrobacterium pusense]MBW9057323.1 helix-turn-helix transcriptional regulator [Agrobacterium pusense]OOO18604.1 transcriptional regulator [Agrobacterium pusense]WKD47170.1 helix-turn-helix domain-containing protein [Agrobacterium pusense]SDF13224.1 transcriptional regulator, ArsR family [Agrobacterium pusense]
MAQFFHPAREDISLTAVLAALGEPARMGIIRKLWGSETGQNCGAAAPCQDMPRSTLSSHMRILREAGLIRTHKQGVENISVVRFDDLEARFPGLLQSIISFDQQ